jgi:hypothetical protein
MFIKTAEPNQCVELEVRVYYGSSWVDKKDLDPISPMSAYGRLIRNANVSHTVNSTLNLACRTALSSRCWLFRLRSVSSGNVDRKSMQRHDPSTAVHERHNLSVAAHLRRHIPFPYAIPPPIPRIPLFERAFRATRLAPKELQSSSQSPTNNPTNATSAFLNPAALNSEVTLTRQPVDSSVSCSWRVWENSRCEQGFFHLGVGLRQCVRSVNGRIPVGRNYMWVCGPHLQQRGIFHSLGVILRQ